MIPVRLGFWARLKAWLDSLFGARRPALPAPRRPWQDQLAQLPSPLQRALETLPRDLPDSVSDLVGDALEDFGHLQELTTGQALESAPIDEVLLLAEAEHAVAELLQRAKTVAIVVSLASRRLDDAPAQSASVEALGALKTECQEIHDITSAAIQYAATLSDEDGSSLKLRADDLHLLVAAHKELEAEL